MAAKWWRREPSGLSLAIRIVPRAGSDRVCGVQAGRLKVRVAAAPVDGAANRRLCRFVAELFGLPPSAVRLLQGERSRDKRLAVDGAASLPPALAAHGEDRG
ncbi:MAG TPA: DUF167 domain-containing protein [Steroidobacteraceae bacterium]|nr:DUF167 domain-containing protein [Steroidobacteraceae bacterium]